MSSPAITETVVSPEEFMESLEALMRRRLGSRVRELEVGVRDRGLVLKGWSTTYHAKQLAQHAAMELSGLPILANEIEVR